MFDELNHRVKNNLGIVIALLNMQARAEAPASDRAQQGCRPGSFNRGPAREPVGAASFGRGRFRGLSGDLVDRLSRSILADGRIGVEVDASSWPVSIDHAVALGIVVNELVTNAAKHAYPPPLSGSIRIRFQPTETGALLTVEDNGRGLPADFAGADGGLGARLVKSFIAQVGGELAIRHRPGATFEIRLPGPPAARSSAVEATTEVLRESH